MKPPSPPFEFKLPQYIANGGSFCPHCGSFDISAPDGVSVEGAGGHQRMECSTCGGTWNDIYQLTGVDLDPEDLKSEVSLPIFCNGAQERILALLSELDRWEQDPDRYAMDVAELAIKARELLHELQEEPSAEQEDSPIKREHQAAIERMRRDGYAVVVFSANECSKIDPRCVEDKLIQYGHDIIPPNDESDPESD
jgi:hypothetical protein